MPKCSRSEGNRRTQDPPITWGQGANFLWASTLCCGHLPYTPAFFNVGQAQATWAPRVDQGGAQVLLCKLVPSFGTLGNVTFSFYDFIKLMQWMMCINAFLSMY